MAAVLSFAPNNHRPASRGHNSGRGVPLHTRDEYTRTNIDACHELGILNRDAALAVWEAALAAGVWEAPGVWLHGDLCQRNLLATDATSAPRSTLAAGSATRLRPDARLDDLQHPRAPHPRCAARHQRLPETGRAWSVSTSVIAIPNFIVTNPTLANTGATLAAVFEDVGLGG